MARTLTRADNARARPGIPHIYIYICIYIYIHIYIPTPALPVLSHYAHPIHVGWLEHSHAQTMRALGPGYPIYIYIYMHIYIYTHIHTHTHPASPLPLRTPHPCRMARTLTRADNARARPGIPHIYIYMHMYIYIYIHIYLRTPNLLTLSHLAHLTPGQGLGSRVNPETNEPLRVNSRCSYT